VLAQRPPAPDSFATRDAAHQAALKLSDRIFEEYGFESAETGIETYLPELRDALYEKAKKDRAARRICHSPDRQYFVYGHQVVDAEIKSESGESDNFSMDVDSHDAVLALDGMYVFRDEGTGLLRACWARQLDFRGICIPEQLSDFSDCWERLATEWPRKRPWPCRPARGSMHPFILIAKNAPYLLPLDQFIHQELLRQQVVGEYQDYDDDLWNDWIGSRSGDTLIRL
jgi:hypothetical protein